ncbi:MAG: family 20 glycosylhydrolase, partial [Armatimonadetes bacterium]|nr:family 20 glycosylhydrolase [Armatimonadota bacterium]
ARGQTVNVEWWKRLIRSLARYKLNALMIYGENDYRFEAYPFLGREGTFTPEKARELSEYAHRYHVQLIPQFESLGHASAVLRSEQLADLREAGSTWVFCTSNPKTWEFLERVIDELCRQFPYAQYIHVGADEFEFDFGKCPSCRAKVEQVGYTGLYAEHMNRLNEIIRKRGRTMLFWPSHGGPTAELSYLTIKAAQAGLMKLDCIPTEWIYHGPAQYPEIKQYQDLGFADVWASPAVVCFSIIWPDYRTTYRGIRGFLRAGAERGIKGAMTTTWEWMHGGVVANSMLGMVYAAECAWSLGRTTVADYERRYAASWLGLPADEASAAMVHELLAMPWPADGELSFMNNAHLMQRLFWSEPRELQWITAQEKVLTGDAGRKVVAHVDGLLERLGQMRAAAKRNADLLRYTELAYRMYRFVGLKLAALQDAAALYAKAAQNPQPPAAAEALSLAAGAMLSPLAELDKCISLYQQAVAEMGAYAGDVERMNRQYAAIKDIADGLQKLAASVRQGEATSLPPAADFGLLRGQAVLIGRWSPEQARTEGFTMRIDVTDKIKGAGTVLVLWRYTRGAHGVSINRTALLANGQQVATDNHRGWTGAGSRDNAYLLALPQFSPGARYEILGELQSSGGNDSYGEVWMIAP